MTNVANDPAVLVRLDRPAFAVSGEIGGRAVSGEIGGRDAFFEVVGEVDAARLRVALSANLEFRIWNDARLGDAVVQVRATGPCALPRIRAMLERAGLTVLGARCGRTRA
jgi:hypothetical protein